MPELKTRRTKASVAAFLSAIPDPQRRKEARTLATLLRKATGKAPAMWGPSIVGYGSMRYEDSKGHANDWFPVGFSPRRAALTIYLMVGLRAHAALLKDLGPHKVGGGCLYITHLADIDHKVLSRLVARSMATNLAAAPREKAGTPRPAKRAV